MFVELGGLDTGKHINFTLAVGHVADFLIVNKW